MNVALRPDSINVISLCTGGGGLDLGLELAVPRARSVVYVEREAFACAHLVAAMQQGFLAEAALWSDVATFDGRPWRGLVDGLIGGIPCQPHSLAGKRLGEDDERDLWGATRRIIVQCRPWFVLIENVRGIVSSGGAERIWRDFRRLGFVMEAGLFTASEVGASHERERWFGLAVADTGNEGLQRSERAGSSDERDGQASPRSASEFRGASLGDAVRTGFHATAYAGIHSPEEGAGARHEDFAGSSSAVADADQSQLQRQPSAGKFTELQSHDGFGPFAPGPNDIASWRNILATAPHLEPAFCRVADGLASRMDVARVDRLRMLGNGVVPLEAAYALRTLATRLAARGVGCATRLVRMMELQP